MIPDRQLNYAGYLFIKWDIKCDACGSSWKHLDKENVSG